jgi:tetratricopeptide (TPR) repeat protein
VVVLSVVAALVGATALSSPGRAAPGDRFRSDPMAPAQWDAVFGHQTRPTEFQHGLGPIHMKVSATSRKAQRWCDQGLALLFGFAHEDAIHAYEKALTYDPDLAIAYWGIAYAYGPNINLAFDADRARKANDALDKAVAHRESASPVERDLIDSLVVRYTKDQTYEPFGTVSRSPLDHAYWIRMNELMARYPDELNVATMTAEAGLDLIPWRTFNYGGKPTLPTMKPETPAIPEVDAAYDILTKVLERDPNHVGAMHYLIHAVEASRRPDRSLVAAERLKSIAWGQPHLVHAGSHIYARTGDWGSGMASGEDAVHGDEVGHDRVGTDNLYWIAHGDHNLYFETSVLSMGGRARETAVKAKELTARVKEQLPTIPEQEYLLPMEQNFLVRFARWHDVLAYPKPKDRYRASLGFWHANRGIASVGTGDLTKAGVELAAAEDVANDKGAAPDDPKLANAAYAFQNNSAKSLLEIDLAVLKGKIAESAGDGAAAESEFRSAVDQMDSLYYDEPPPFYYPVRETLGGYLLRAGRPAEAEQVFRDDLIMFPGNGRSLFGIWKALEARGEDAQSARDDFNAAWRWADVPLSVETLG